jgi:hypothetical protein
MAIADHNFGSPSEPLTGVSVTGLLAQSYQ